jgi:predicted ester cyclase
MSTEHQKQTSVASSPTGMTRDEIVAMFARRQEAFDDLDAAALAADYADDVVIESPMSGTHGKADAERYLRAFFDAFLDLKATFEPPVIDGQHVAVIGKCEGTNMGGFMGMAPSGRGFKLQTVMMFELKGRKIVHEQRIYDFTGMLVQVGILKAKPV